jgi:hypothetical protein
MDIQAMQAECPLVDIKAQTTMFLDHTFKDAKTDWPATWRNWMRTKQERLTEGGKPGSTGFKPVNKQQALEDRNRAVADAWASGSTSEVINA